MNKMEKEFVKYEQALALKELGFDEPCFAFYLAGGVRYKEYKDSQNKNSAFYNDTVCSIPTFSQAFRWFREKHQLYAWVKIEYEYGGIIPTYYITGKRQDDIAGGPFKTYEEAELECLKKLIEIVKK